MKRRWRERAVNMDGHTDKLAALYSRRCNCCLEDGRRSIIPTLWIRTCSIQILIPVNSVRFPPFSIHPLLPSFNLIPLPQVSLSLREPHATNKPLMAPHPSATTFFHRCFFFGFLFTIVFDILRALATTTNSFLNSSLRKIIYWMKKYVRWFLGN